MEKKTKDIVAKVVIVGSTAIAGAVVSAAASAIGYRLHLAVKYRATTLARNNAYDAYKRYGCILKAIDAMF